MGRARKKPTKPVEFEFIVLPADDDELSRFIDGCSHYRPGPIDDGAVLVKSYGAIHIVEAGIFAKTYDIIEG